MRVRDENAGGKPQGEAELKAAGQAEMKNQNPNQNHNTKKESLGRNTKR